MLTSTFFRNWLLALLLLAGVAPARAQRLAAGTSHTMSIHADGTLWAWGQNVYGQLGLGNQDYQTAGHRR